MASSAGGDRLEPLGDLQDRLVDAAARRDRVDRHPLGPRRVDDLGRVGDVPGDRHLQRLLGLLQADLASRASPLG